MTSVTTSQIEKVLNKYGKTIKEGRQYEKAAHEITFDYMGENLATSIKPDMEKNLVSLLADVTENKN